MGPRSSLVWVGQAQPVRPHTYSEISPHVTPARKTVAKSFRRLFIQRRGRGVSRKASKAFSKCPERDGQSPPLLLECSAGSTRPRDPLTGLSVKIRKPGPTLLGGSTGLQGLHAFLWHFLIGACLYIYFPSVMEIYSLTFIVIHVQYGKIRWLRWTIIWFSGTMLGTIWGALPKSVTFLMTLCEQVSASYNLHFTGEGTQTQVGP